ncbi:MAG TPA: polysaccharide biosynthesis tyrosine autokinase [Candidatus Sulfomarinibacteraceae bacterium]|nr:polysaccharide biosynthesis tyrosine autokinase [Candidatus Sulfomarinibacteraceae bacterium]
MEIRRYVAIIQRWFWLLLLATVLAGGTAYIVSIQTTPVYRSTARLLIDQAPGSGGNEYAQVLLEQRLATTYVELIKLTTVMVESVERLDLPLRPEQLAAKLTVSAPPETQLIVLSAEDNNPERAALIANTVAEVFIDQNQARQASRYEESIRNWRDRMADLREEISELEALISEFGEPTTVQEEVELSRLETDLREAEIRYTDAFNNLEQLRVEQARGTNNVVMVEAARPTASPVRPRPLLNTLLGALAGGMAALGLVLLIEYMDDTIKSPEQIEELAGLATLGTIALIKGKSDDQQQLVTQETPRDPVSEAYRVLRTNISFSAVDGGTRSILVTSASPAEGKSTTAANLAVVTAQAGKRVIVVDSDLRRPSLDSVFELPNHHGLTSALLDNRRPLTHYLQNTRVAGLRLLSSGPIPPNPAEMLNSQRMSQIIDQLEDEADTVIFDTPPVLSVADASILAPQVCGCLLVVHSGQTRFAALQQAAEALINSHAQIYGAVLNQIVVGRSHYYYYRYYSYEQQSAEPRRLVSRLPDWISGLSRR